MFQLDDKFLQDVGLGDLPEDQKQAFLQHIYSELELRVGTKLSEGMNEGQLAEFEAFVDRNEQKVRAWFDRNAPNYEQENDYKSLKSSVAGNPQVTELDLLSEYGSLKWLQLNRSDYREVVASEMEKLKKEILKNKDAILGGGAEAA